VLNFIKSLKFQIKSILFSVKHHPACPYSNKTTVDYSRIKKIMLKRQSVTSAKDVARKRNGVQLINRHRENQATALCERISTLSDQYDAGRCTTLNFGMLKKVLQSRLLENSDKIEPAKEESVNSDTDTDSYATTSYADVE